MQAPLGRLFGPVGGAVRPHPYLIRLFVSGLRGPPPPPFSPHFHLYTLQKFLQRNTFISFNKKAQKSIKLGLAGGNLICYEILYDPEGDLGIVSQEMFCAKFLLLLLIVRKHFLGFSCVLPSSCFRRFPFQKNLVVSERVCTHTHSGYRKKGRDERDKRSGERKEKLGLPHFLLPGIWDACLSVHLSVSVVLTATLSDCATAPTRWRLGSFT